MTSPEVVDRVADAISRKKGAGPLHLMPESSAGQYRAMARAAMTAMAMEDACPTCPSHDELRQALARLVRKTHALDELVRKLALKGLS